MTDTPRPLRAICFDLDGTLLPMDLDAFMKSYFDAIYDFVAGEGLDAGAFMERFNAGVRAMAGHTDGRTNADAYWEAFGTCANRGRDFWEPLLNEFYEGPFGELGREVRPNPAAARAVGALAAKGYPLVLATMPMFPLAAVRHRLRWAGIDPDAFARITHYENSTAVKPRGLYYAENLAALGVSGADVLMVGNNTVEDMAFADLGAEVFLVTDWLLDPAGLDLGTVRHGTMADFAAWAEALPPCARPAGPVAFGPVSRADAESALAANARGGLAAAEADALAAAAAEDAVSHGRSIGAAVAQGGAAEEVR